eukprot:TRINITY_DN13516_c0_g1_i1.p1 TRINITY_DN13516_c0_g1~~TRINITY_DN13516_c0_g1_i1.p1  ORF type:complete len:248 (+),score=7.60 TRINITY_DN13516_c0_g1_i1:33-776(+)
MTYTLFAGCLLLVTAPLLVLFFLVVIRKAQLIVIAIGSAFFWLLSIQVSAIFWFIIPPLRNQFFFIVPCTVLIQEFFRWLYYALYTKTESSFTKSTGMNVSPLNPLECAVATGFGSATAYIAVMYVSVLWESLGPGTLFSAACPSLSVFIVSSLYGLCFVLQHLCFAIISFEGFRKISYPMTAFVVVTHLLASLFTVIGQVGGTSACSTGISLEFGLLLIIIAGTCYVLSKATTYSALPINQLRREE